MFKMIRLGRRVSQGPRLNSMGVRGAGGDPERCAVKVSLALVWGLNAAYAVPGLFFTTAKRLSTAQGGNLMLISSTTRPLLGCVWDFGPGGQGAGFVFIMSSLVVHELVPIVLMVVTNAASLVALRRFAAERKQGQQQGQQEQGQQQQGQQPGAGAAVGPLARGAAGLAPGQGLRPDSRATAPWGRETPEKEEDESCRVYDGVHDGVHDGVYDGVHDGVYDGVHDGVYDGVYDGSDSGAARDPAGGVREPGSKVIGEPPASDVGGSTGGPRALATDRPTGPSPCGQPGPTEAARGHAASGAHGGDGDPAGASTAGVRHSPGGGVSGGGGFTSGVVISGVVSGGVVVSATPGLAAEVRATRLVLALVGSFLASWGSHILAVNFYNFGGQREGPLAGALLAVARFSASTFLAVCPLVLALGHAPLRRRLSCCCVASPRRRRAGAGGVRVVV
ncbi:unnamed protein product [Lampetra fluviatilis]